jgi:hypothetical protein
MARVDGVLAPFAVRRFGGIYAGCDPAIRMSVVRGLIFAHDRGIQAAAEWLRTEDFAADGGWSEFAVAALFALNKSGEKPS